MNLFDQMTLLVSLIVVIGMLHCVKWFKDQSRQYTELVDRIQRLQRLQRLQSSMVQNEKVDWKREGF